MQVKVEQLITFLYKERSNYKGLAVLKDLLQNEELFNLFLKHMESGKILPFDDQDFSKIENQNIRGINNFIDVFREGFNIGCCTPTSKQLSYSFDNVDLVSGLMENLKGTKNSPNGEHSWMEVDGYIYDTTLMLKIDKSLAKELGYKEENRIMYSQLCCDKFYSCTKDYTNDSELRRKK